MNYFFYYEMDILSNLVLFYSFSLWTSQRSCPRTQKHRRRKQHLLLLPSWKFHCSTGQPKIYNLTSKPWTEGMIILYCIQRSLTVKSIWCSRKSVLHQHKRPLPPPNEVIHHDNARMAIPHMPNLESAESTAPAAAEPVCFLAPPS